MSLNSQQILQKYLDFYKEKGHKQIPNVSLVPENDPTLLYVNSGMFPLVPYLSGQPHPMGKRLVNVQRCLRFFEDLENVGQTNRHTTAFHMIGNWSLGDYFKDEQLPWAYEFLVETLELDPQKMYATVFAGDKDAPRDQESIEIIKNIFKKYGIEAKENERIFARGKEDNWWKRGEAVGELGGPDSEVFYFIGNDGNGFGLNPTEHQDDFLELGNSVFMQYRKAQDGWKELAQKNVDFGGGLERIALAVQNKQDIFETDNFLPIIEKAQQISKRSYTQDFETTKAMRILADHMRAATFLAMDGVLPSNKDQGYILRRLLRRMVRAGRVLGLEKDMSVTLVPVVAEVFAWLYPDLAQKQKEIQRIFSEEENKFRKTLIVGSREAKKMLVELWGVDDSKLTKRRNMLVPWDFAKIAFNLYQSYGYPFEMFVEDVKDLEIELDLYEAEEEFNKKIREHQQKSREGAEQKFKGGLADHSEQVVKYHTATHLLHWALREVLGTRVKQMGSNITGERLRFDFSHSEKITEDEIAEIEKLVNEKIAQKVPVGAKTMPKEEAQKTGALSFFKEKYGDMVNVYYIGDSLETAFSKEFCGGPHVKNTGVLEPLEIYKQEKIGENILRIYSRFLTV